MFFPEVETGENRDAARPIWQWTLVTPSTVWSGAVRIAHRWWVAAFRRYCIRLCENDYLVVPTSSFSASFGDKNGPAARFIACMGVTRML
ncbi:MAG: hypothetical protein JWP89_4519 [Schlesneria sp.]|nr:hypothetical protein [Schlesneria sp.]